MLDIGIFDHVDRGATPLRQFYEDRLQIVEAYDRAGFYSYHVAEHHFTPLGMAASPGIFLSSVAQRTKRLRFGPMVYCLPLYHPLRLAEEICMLDQISGGRLDVGVGRGISPLESRIYGENSDVDVSRKVYNESLQILRAALSEKQFSFVGEHRKAEDVQMILETIQQPHPPLWMGVQSPESAEFAARNGMSILGLLPAPALHPLFERYRTVWAETQSPSRRPGKTGVGLFVVVGETDVQARNIARRAYQGWHKSFHYLYHLHGQAPVRGNRPDDFDAVIAELRGIAGTPETVLRFIQERVKEAECDYVTGQFVFGDMTKAEAMHSINLFSSTVSPALKTISAKAATVA